MLSPHTRVLSLPKTTMTSVPITPAALNFTERLGQVIGEDKALGYNGQIDYAEPTPRLPAGVSEEARRFLAVVTEPADRLPVTILGTDVPADAVPAKIEQCTLCEKIVYTGGAHSHELEPCPCGKCPYRTCVSSCTPYLEKFDPDSACVGPVIDRVLE